MGRQNRFLLYPNRRLRSHWYGLVHGGTVLETVLGVERKAQGDSLIPIGVPRNIRQRPRRAIAPHTLDQRWIHRVVDQAATRRIGAIRGKLPAGIIGPQELLALPRMPVDRHAEVVSIDRPSEVLNHKFAPLRE